MKVGARHGHARERPRNSYLLQGEEGAFWTGPFGRTPAHRGSADVGTVVLTSDASHFYHHVETRQRVQIIGILPEMLTAFETIDRFAGSAKLVVAGHDPQIADRFKPVEPGIIKIA